MASKPKDAGTAESVDYLKLAEQTHQKAQGSTDCPFWMQVGAALREAHALTERQYNVLKDMAVRESILRAEVERLRGVLREAREAWQRGANPNYSELSDRIDAELGEKHDR
jgi:hypothetical protein